MEIVPWRSRQISPISSLQSEMNRMFEDFFNQPFGLPMQRVRTQQATVVPALDVKEDDHSIVVTAELPGIDPNDVEISVHEDMLEIRGQKSEEQKREEENYCLVERSFGSFARRINLPAEVDSDHAEARMENGVLTLRMPKSGPKAGKKTINIQGASRRQGNGQTATAQARSGQSTTQSMGAESRSAQSSEATSSQSPS